MISFARASKSVLRGCFGIAAVMLAVTGGACAESPTEPSHYSAFTKTDLVVGTGTEVANGQSLTVNYTGWLYDANKAGFRGAQFDSSVGRTPFTFVLNAIPAQVIAGWDQGVPGMRVGGVRQLVIPPSLAYGETRRGQIPANSTLIFEIELLDAK